MDILMPQLGETVAEGTIAQWHKQAGDAVEKGDMLLDVETDKVATEITAPESGTLTSILIPEGETVDVGTVLAVIAVDGETQSDDSPQTAAAPAAAVAAAAPQGLPARSANGRLSPVVRRLVKQHKLDVAGIAGSGRDGRITRADVLQIIESGGAAPAVPATDGNRLPFDRIRKVTAEHMLRSKSISPHVLQAIDVDFNAVDRARLARKQQWKSEHGFSLTYLPFTAHAVCRAIRDFPRINASVDNDALIVHEHINLAIAIDLNHEGLLAAVTRNADALSVSQLALAFNDLVTRAKTNKLSPDDLQGGTYTLSNPGPYGTLFTAPIINQPQVAILSMDAVKKRPQVLELESGDVIAVRPVGMLAQSFDHRAIDGAYSAAYLQRLKTLIETTDWDGVFQ